MKPFRGFPARMEFSPIPSPFFSQLMPQIGDIAELKTTLHILGAIYRKKGSPRFVTLSELLADASLMSSLRGAAEPAEEVLSKALKMATQRETFLHLVIDGGKKPEGIYLLNTPSNRLAVAKIQSGELKLPGLTARIAPHASTEELPNIFTLYEENIGMLTPMIAEELKEAEKLYPITWINDAIKEAVNQNKRKWGYISAILERWSAEGKSDGAYRRDYKKEDPDKYIKGRYGHMVRRFGR
jgi:DnaD/phage-associated family protein